MWDIKKVKARGRAAFKANYLPCVIVALLLSLLVRGGVGVSVRNARSQATPTDEVPLELQSAVTDLNNAIEALPEDAKATLAVAVLGGLFFFLIVGILLKIFVWNPLEVGCHRFFTKNVESGPAPMGLIGEGFGSFGHVFATLFLRDLIIALCCMLLIVPGIIKAYSYRFVPYIIRDEPNLTASEVLSHSKEMMRGNKWRAFVLDLSFLGWALLGLVTLGIVDIFWTSPYYQSTDAALYLELRGR